MPLEAPNLDTLSFDELVRRARLRIPRYTREWTDFNDSDPGMTLVQLFAWFTETMLFQMNQVPDRNYIQFLRLLNLELEPAQSARADVTFSAAPGTASAPIVPARTPIMAQPAGGEPLIFETEKDLGLIRWPLVDVCVVEGGAPVKVTEANDKAGVSYRPLGWQPQPGHALYLGFKPPDTPAGDLPFPREMRFWVGLPPEAASGAPQRASDATQPPGPQVTLVWEYKPAEGAVYWRRLNVLKDESAAFTREGYVLVEGPADIAPTTQAMIAAQPRYWLRCRLADGNYASGQRPVIDYIRPNTVRVLHQTTIREEAVGASDGYPNQAFKLRHAPVLPKSLVLVITEPGEAAKTWKLVDDLLASGEDDTHFTLDRSTGEIRFGDGAHGCIPLPGASIVAREYRYGGGAAGNVGAGLIKTLIGSVDGVQAVTNERPAVGGADEQTLEDKKKQAPSELRRRSRAVTQEDFASLAKQAGGVAKATAIALYHPDHPGVELPGVVTVVIVPESPDPQDRQPQPSSDLKHDVCGYLNGYRLITSELYVNGPSYVPIRVEARVSAERYASPDAVTRDVLAALEAHLDPLGRYGATGTDGEAGWEFGKDFYPTGLYKVILDVAQVQGVSSLTVRVNDQEQDITRPISVARDGLVCSAGNHTISVTPATDTNPVE